MNGGGRTATMFGDVVLLEVELVVVEVVVVEMLDADSLLIVTLVIWI